MQNFDFNSLYSPGAGQGSEGGFHRPGPQDYSQMPKSSVAMQKSGPKKEKKSSILTLFLAVAVLFFSGGLVLGLKLNSSSSPTQDGIDAKTRSFLNRNHSTGTLSQKDQDASGKKAPARKTKKDRGLTLAPGKKLYVKLQPKLSAPQARQAATALLAKKMQVYYKKLSDGSYYLFIGPYKSVPQGRRTLSQLKKMSVPGLDNLEFRLVQR